MYVFSLSAASVLHNDVNRILFLGGHFPTLAQLCQREYDKSSNVTARVFALDDKFFIINSGDMSCPRPVYSIGNLLPFSMPIHSNSKFVNSIIISPQFRSNTMYYIIGAGIMLRGAISSIHIRYS